MSPSILVIKNGKCTSDIDNIIKQIDPMIEIDTIHSSEVDDYVSKLVIESYNAVIILGGHQSLVNRLTQGYMYPYLNHLINYLKQWIDHGVHVMGICLGAQMIGEAIGLKTIGLGKTESGYEKNIVIDSKDSLFDNVDLRYVLSLHNDYIQNESTESLDKKGIQPIAHLCRSGNDKILYGFKKNNAYGLQFHPEITINVLKVFCSSFTFDEEMIKYARNNLKYIKKTSKQLFQNWITSL